MILTSLLLGVLERPLGAEEQRVGVANIGVTESARPLALAGSCPSEVSAHTDADFGGGQYTVQAGFAEQEVAAASWTLDPAVFPIRLDVAEMIFATSNTNVTTTTEWTFFVWSGTPASGNVVAQYSSDGELLPHIVLLPGTNGVNVQVLVDPDDPEQIIINDTGDSTFSIGYRIDRHHNQTSNPCLVAPPSTQNAFPTTDVGGLQAPSQNWLFGVNCGFLGCPPNGGWSSFADLNILCRPSGDWVMRATWTSLSCNQTLGACCLPNGACGLETANDCVAQGGLFEGDNVPCTNVECPPALGACCASGVCSTQAADDCLNTGGTWQGAGTLCSETDCNAGGACCIPSTGGCLSLPATDCGLVGGTFSGPGTLCGTTVCFPEGACCLDDGTCVEPTTPEDCNAAGGVFQGNETDCVNTDCPDPEGACCVPATGACLVLTNANCGVVGGQYAGDGTVCENACATNCAEDLDGSGAVDFPDLIQLLSAFGPCDGCPEDLNGSGAVEFDDLIALLSVWGNC